MCTLLEKQMYVYQQTGDYNVGSLFVMKYVLKLEYTSVLHHTAQQHEIAKTSKSSFIVQAVGYRRVYALVYTQTHAHTVFNQNCFL
jgi:hypothetical protein